MVPPSPTEFLKHVPGYLESLCGPLPMFCSPKTEHKHPTKHQVAGERVAQRLHEAVPASSTPSGILQYGCHPVNLQEKYQPEHTLF